jgi:hypothetical protein
MSCKYRINSVNLNNRFGPFSAKELTRSDFFANNVIPDSGLESYLLKALEIIDVTRS